MVRGLHHRQHLDAGKGRLAAALIVERADPDEPVGALLHRQRAVGIGGLDLEGGGFDAGLFGVGGLVDLGGEVVALGPAQVHPHQHLGEVGRVHPAGLGADGDQRLAGVIGAVEQRLHLEFTDGLLEFDQLGLDLGPGLQHVGGVLIALGHPPQHPGIVQPAAQVLHPAHLTLGVAQLRGHLLGVFRVVPELRVRGLGLQFGYLSTQLGNVEDGLDTGQGCRQLFQLGGNVSHNSSDYWSRAAGQAPEAASAHRHAGRRSRRVAANLP